MAAEIPSVDYEDSPTEADAQDNGEPTVEEITEAENESKEAE